LKHVITSFKKRKLKESDAHQYQHNEQSPLIFFTEYKKTTTYDDGQKIMRSANNVGNAGPHVRQTFLNDVFTFLTEVGNAGRIVNTGTSSVNSELVTALNM
jgi:ABC-type enterochelin transport system substrate-binding protein